MSIIILVCLIIINGLFAMSEIALVTAKKNRLQRLADEGNISAQKAIELGESPTQFLSTMQIGITVIGIMNGVIGEAALAGPISHWLIELGFPTKSVGFTASAIAVIVLTYVSIVIGELVPKRLGQVNAVSIAIFFARPIAVIAFISRPFVWLLANSTDLLLRLLGKGKDDSSALTEDDIRAVIAEGSQSGVIHQHEHNMMRNVFNFDDRKVSSMMTPRNEITYLDLNYSPESYLQKLLSSTYACLPVGNNGFSDLKGTLNAKQLLQFINDNTAENPLSILDYLTPPVFVPENWTGTTLLEMFQSSGTDFAFVVDEYGDIQGIVTSQDILEALAGKFTPDNPKDVWSEKNPDGSWNLDGMMPITVFKDLLDINKLPDEEDGGYHTLSGMLVWLLDDLPKLDDCIRWQGWQFRILTLENNRIDRILAQRYE
ncbi:hemolysin family protein [Photobacterium angustum]|uniref:hemolysin family protein n=1 Tax=Photobacterium angustum TaxID=661 RepID=UPI0005DC6F3F|nr:hemolysin family protein [Photobacterium angustum]KJG01434.1 membrane protein [Photobacterium angustum]PSV63894.1 HlyC/CorC family transporter [Photobacterium angustum]